MQGECGKESKQKDRRQLTPAQCDRLSVYSYEYILGLCRTMPSFFPFTQGTESHVQHNDTSPLLGRFRAVPPRDQPSGRRQSGLLSNRRGSVHVGYGALVVGEILDADDEDDDSDDDSDDGTLSRWERIWQRWVVDLWVRPKQLAVKRIAEKWWTRYGLLVFLPAALVRCPPPRVCSV